MHLPTIRAKRQLQDDLDRRLADTQPITPRKAAVALLHDKIRAGEAGLDPYDASVFIVELGRNETRWGTIVVSLTGKPTQRVERPDGSVRLYALLDQDVRGLLGLNEEDPPLMCDEPLASRGIRSVPDLAEAARDLVAPSTRQISVGEPVSMAALRAAKDAYDRREGQVH
jgi:hypothetical protein